MFEHVGPKNYRTFFSKIASLLQSEGLFLLHTIGAGDHTCRADQWTEKYIFPNGVIPSMHTIVKASEDVLVMEDWHNFGADYDHQHIFRCLNNGMHGWNNAIRKYVFLGPLVCSTSMISGTNSM
jgi:cyclopropane fatty-acyl-phospholipid synthase-like methyltransferase